jgi:hypothetical protein
MSGLTTKRLRRADRRKRSAAVKTARILHAIPRHPFTREAAELFREIAMHVLGVAWMKLNVTWYLNGTKALRRNENAITTWPALLDRLNQYRPIFRTARDGAKLMDRLYRQFWLAPIELTDLTLAARHQAFLDAQPARRASRHASGRGR